MLSSDRLWVGTGNGVILSIPLVAAKPTRAANNSASTSHEGNQVSVGVSQREKTGFMPYCSMVCGYSLSCLDLDCIRSNTCDSRFLQRSQLDCSDPIVFSHHIIHIIRDPLLTIILCAPKKGKTDFWPTNVHNWFFSSNLLYAV